MRTLIVILALLLPSGLAHAQACVLGLYADPLGTLSFYEPIPNQPFDIYLVLQVEDVVGGMAFTVEFPDFLFVSTTSYGPNGGGINVPTSGGENVGIGECAIGFNQQPIVIASYWALTTTGGMGLATVGANSDENPLYPVYASCSDQIVACEVTSDLYFEVLGTESASFGTVKSLYGN